MAEGKVDFHPGTVRQWLPWTEIFRGFQIALDPKKLLLAAAGILAMAFLWWLWAILFDWLIFPHEPYRSDYVHDVDPPATLTTDKDRSDFQEEQHAKQEAQWAAEHRKWEILKEAAGDPDSPSKPAGARWGKLRQWPWFEDRGPNPYLLVTGQEGTVDAEGRHHPMPWVKGEFADWLLTKQGPVLVEPLVRFFQPVVFLLRSGNGFWNHVYFILVILSTLLVWAFFGGAITRMAVVQAARKEKIGMTEACRFAWSRFLSFFSAPVFPLLFIAFVVVMLFLYGLIHLIPVFGDVVWDGLTWPLVLLAGLVMAVVLVGLVGWPMMYSTISAEGSDSFDALSRTYSYVYQSPWSYVWYSLVAVAYGAVLIFFIGFMGSLMVYLGKWGVRQNGLLTLANRDPEYLFVYAPTSFGWRDLLLRETPAIDAAGNFNPKGYSDYVETLKPYNKIGAFMVAAWLYLAFLMIIGFGYSFFWSASSIIYLLMRRKVDDTELDEVYLEEDELEDGYAPPVPPPVVPATSTSLPVVEPPPKPVSTPPPPFETAPADGGIGGTPPASP